MGSVSGHRVIGSALFGRELSRLLPTLPAPVAASWFSAMGQGSHPLSQCFQSIGATSSSHSHSWAHCSHSSRTHLHSHHCSRYRQRHGRGGLLLPGVQPVLRRCKVTKIFRQPTHLQYIHFQKNFARLRRDLFFSNAPAAFGLLSRH